MLSEATWNVKTSQQGFWSERKDEPFPAPDWQ